MDADAVPHFTRRLTQTFVGHSQCRPLPLCRVLCRGRDTRKPWATYISPLSPAIWRRQMPPTPRPRRVAQLDA